jgi:hypothetical protein
LRPGACALPESGCSPARSRSAAEKPSSRKRNYCATIENQGVTRYPVCRGMAATGVFGRTPRSCPTVSGQRFTACGSRLTAQCEQNGHAEQGGSGRLGFYASCRSDGRSEKPGAAGPRPVEFDCCPSRPNPAPRFPISNLIVLPSKTHPCPHPRSRSGKSSSAKAGRTGAASPKPQAASLELQAGEGRVLAAAVGVASAVLVQRSSFAGVARRGECCAMFESSEATMCESADTTMYESPPFDQLDHPAVPRH